MRIFCERIWNRACHLSPLNMIDKAYTCHFSYEIAKIGKALSVK